jgi:hypothetical protein
MMRHLATIREIAAVRPIAGADKIEVAQVDGWECVVKKGEFQVGQPIVYIEVDSVVPERPEFEFLRDRKFRVRTIKLRGQVSQGLVLPMSILPTGEYTVGSDVTETLGITKYDPQAKLEDQLLNEQLKTTKNPIAKYLMRYSWYRKLVLKRKKANQFPGWIKKTDETRIQNLTTLFDIERKKGTTFSVTEKVDGQSATYFLRKVARRKYEFGVCSRNIRLATPNDSSYWSIAKKYNIENVLKSLIGEQNSVVLQGEICGNAIQGNKYHISGYEFFAFNLIYPDHKCTTAEIGELIKPFHMKTVPIVEEGKKLPDSIAELVEYSKGHSVIRGGQKREGIVMRNTQNDISFKVINPDFLLAEKD